MHMASVGGALLLCVVGAHGKLQPVVIFIDLGCKMICRGSIWPEDMIIACTSFVGTLFALVERSRL